MKKKIGLLIALVSLFNISCEDDSPDVVQEEIVDWTETQHRGKDFIDLGLPSGTLWATDDVSAKMQNEELSYFFSWGEISPKSSYTSANYKYASGVDDTLTKYCTVAESGKNGFVDGLTELQPIDDVANLLWGGRWFIPTWEKWEELYENCTWETVTKDGKSLFVATSKINGNEIIFSARGMKTEKMNYEGEGAYYWSSTLIHDNCMYANGLSITSSSVNKQDGLRVVGHCVRAVVPGEQIASEAVDLGLPSGIKWASTNIGAKLPEQAGNLYAWGEIKTKAFYSFTTYKHCNGTPDTLIKYCTNKDYGTPDGKTQLDKEDDAATQLWGNGWRMPTVTEIQELIDCCTWTFETIGEQTGYRATGKNGNSIYIPIVGTMWESTMEYMRGLYWSSTLDDAGDKFAEGLFLNQNLVTLGNQFIRASGRTIRPVNDCR